ncbi:6,7-dimethyl-8-ribityllumazine synthase [soil metagenome]
MKNRIAYISARWFEEILTPGKVAFQEEISRRGFDAKNIDFFEVPGAFELPLMAKLLAKKGKYDLIVLSAFVVDGGIYAHQFVASTVIDAIMRTQLETEVPMLSFVLTPQQFDEKNPEHIDFFSKHMVVKGTEMARSAMQTLENLKALA